MRPLERSEIPPPVPYIEGVRSWGGGCEHWHKPHFPCGNRAGYMFNDERLCASHAMSRVRQLMFRRVPISIQVEAA